MRNALGAIFIFAMFIAWGLLDAPSDEPLLEAGLQATADKAIAEATHDVRVEIIARDIKVFGFANDAGEKRRLLEGLREIEGRGKIIDELNTIPKVSPFSLRLVYTTQGGSFLEGNVPTEDDREKLRGTFGNSVDELVLASGALDENWANVVLTGAAAFQYLISGTLHISDTSVWVTGLAQSPAEVNAINATLEKLSDFYEITVEVEPLDDGEPVRVILSKGKAGSFTISGKAPKGFETIRLTDSVEGKWNVALRSSELQAPFVGWENAVVATAKALSGLTVGSVLFDAREVVVFGVARSHRAKVAVEDLESEIFRNAADLTTHIVLEDDGEPFSISVFISSEGAAMSGKAPEGADRILASILSSSVDTDALAIAGINASESWWTIFANGARELQFVKEGTLLIEEDKLSLEATVLGREELIEIENRLQPLALTYEVHLELDVLNDERPFELHISHDGQAAVAAGHVPEGFDIQSVSVDLGMPLDATKVSVLQRGDETGWADAVRVTAAAVVLLEEADFVVGPAVVAVEGVALGPEQASEMRSTLNLLDHKVTVTIEVELLDDGRPPEFTILYKAESGATVFGKLPFGIQVNDLARMLRLPTIGGAPSLAFLDGSTSIEQRLLPFVRWLPEVEVAQMTFSSGVLTIEADISPGSDIELIGDEVRNNMQLGDTLELNPMNARPTQGATRTNASSRIIQEFYAGYWLPVVDFLPNLSNCQDLTQEALKKNSIGFVAGSSKLNANSIKAINLISSIVRRCTESGELVAEIAGYTDSSGGSKSNLQLSEDRAIEVKTALIVRGVPHNTVSAVGYGEQYPIADNSTESGRAANRRTQITWNFN